MDSFFNPHEITNKPSSNESARRAHLTADKLFSDAYEYRSENKNFALSNELIIRDSLRILGQRLLLEIIYFEALSIYFENLYARSYQSRGEDPYFYRGHSNPYKNHCADKHHNSSKLDKYSYANKPDGAPSVADVWTAPVNSISPQHPLANLIIETARHNLGRPIWAFSKFASICERGYLGCAASVSELLNLAGVGTKGSASVSELVNELVASGWHKIKISDKHQFAAGDIVYGLKGQHAHIGIITQADKDRVLVCDNSSSSGTLKERTIEASGSFTPDGRFAGSLYVLRAQSI